MVSQEELLADLTPSQKAAVEHVDGPLLIVAAAGSGKTRVITRRVAYLISLGIPQQSILAITFTNKAAGEMKERVGKVMGRPLLQDWPGAVLEYRKFLKEATMEEMRRRSDLAVTHAHNP